MNNVQVVSNVLYSMVSLDLGAVKCVVGHTGIDDQRYLDVQLEHGRLSMTADTMRELVRRGQEALAAQKWSFPDCSGSAWGGE